MRAEASWGKPTRNLCVPEDDRYGGFWLDILFKDTGVLQGFSFRGNLPCFGLDCYFVFCGVFFCGKSYNNCYTIFSFL